jgi:hypothetical protein
MHDWYRLARQASLHHSFEKIEAGMPRPVFVLNETPRYRDQKERP